MTSLEWGPADAGGVSSGGGQALTPPDRRKRGPYVQLPRLSCSSCPRRYRRSERLNHLPKVTHSVEKLESNPIVGCRSKDYENTLSPCHVPRMVLPSFVDRCGFHPG